MSGNYRERSASISSSNFLFPERSPTIHSDDSDFSDAESDASTLSESTVSTYFNKSSASAASSNRSFKFESTRVTRDGQQNLANMIPAERISFLRPSTLDPWSATTAYFDVEGYLAKFSSIPLVQDPRRIFAHSSDRTITFGKKDASGCIAPVPLLRCLRLEGTSNLDSPNKSVFEGAVLQKFMFKVTVSNHHLISDIVLWEYTHPIMQWPGYETWQRDLLEEFSYESVIGAPITREMLASLIAREYQLFSSVCSLFKNDLPTGRRLT